jgi:hypothetical protein
MHVLSPASGRWSEVVHRIHDLAAADACDVPVGAETVQDRALDAHVD